MNYLYMLSNRHYGGMGADPPTLHHAANIWRRKKIKKEKVDFFALEELIIHSFKARVVAAYWSLLSETGLDNLNNFDDVVQATRSQNSKAFIAQVDRILEIYIQRHGEDDSDDDQELEDDPELEDVQEFKGDQEFQNHCLFL